jgi:hypothetical protein
MQNIERACSTALNMSIDDAFKVLNDPNVREWHAGMRVIDILDQLSATYGIGRGSCPKVAKISNPLFDPKKVFRHVQFTHLMVTLKF